MVRLERCCHYAGVWYPRGIMKNQSRHVEINSGCPRGSKWEVDRGYRGRQDLASRVEVQALKVSPLQPRQLQDLLIEKLAKSIHELLF